MRKCHLMDGLATQSQHERGTGAPFREKKNKRKRKFKNHSRLAGAVIALELPASINKVRDRAPSSESIQE